MSIHWAAAKTTWTAHTKEGTVYSLSHLHPMQVTMDIEVNKAPKQIRLHIGFASHVFTRTPEPEDDPADIYKNERERRTFDPERYELSHRLPDLVRNLCEGKAKCYFNKRNNFFVFQALNQPGVEYRAFFDVEKVPGFGMDALVMIVQSAYRADMSLQAPSARRSKPVGFKLLLTKVMEGSRPVEPR